MTPVASLKRDFERSWMSHDGYVRDLDAEVRRRQRSLLARTMKTSEHIEPPYAVDALVGDLRREVNGVDDRAARRALRWIMIDVVLIAELVASALCPDPANALGIYPAPNDRDWEFHHAPMRVLRNAILHPGAIKPGKKNSSVHLGEMVDTLWRVFDRSSETSEQAALLEESPANLFSPEVARWAVNRLHALGIYDGRRVRLEWPPPTAGV